MISLTMIWACCGSLIRSRVDSERGASVIEYAFLVSLIAAFCVAGITLVGGATSASLSESASKLP